MQMIDTHAHLDLLDDPEAAIARAREAGVVQMVSIGIDLSSSRKAADLARSHDCVFHTVGLHPHDADRADEAMWAQMAELAQGGARAVGECGLDFFRDRSPRPAQREAFARQIALARELGLPLVIHDRDAHSEVAAMLREHGAADVGGVVHCFSGDMDFAEKVVGLGFLIGVTGTVTYPKNDALRLLCRRVGLHRLVLETDCPFLSPQPRRGKPNQPAYIPMICESLALTLGTKPEDVASVTTANARRLYSLPEVE